MSVTRFGINAQGAFTNLTDGGNVSYQDYEKLAAENAGLKAIVSGINNELYGQGFMVSGWHLNGALEPLDNWFTDNGWGEPETSATDALLAEVRASELDSLAGVAETMLVKFSNQGASEIPEAKGWEMIRRQASQRAAQLRKGVQS